MAGIDAARFREPPRRQAPPYADAAYWEARYQASKDAFEWYLGWEHLQPVLMPLLLPPDPVVEGDAEEAAEGGDVKESEPAAGDAAVKSKDAEILVLGCGTSTLSQDLYADGFSNITNVDRNEFVVEAMRERHQEQVDALAGGGAKGGKAAAKKDAKAPLTPEPGAEARKQMQFEAMDARALPAKWAGRFDVVIDKALLDSIACGEQKWKGAEGLMKSVGAVLKPGTGVYVCVSFAGPDARRKMLVGPHQESESDTSEAYGWVFGGETVPRPLAPAVVDPKAAKDKGGGEFKEGPAYDAEKDVYHVYTCRMAELADDIS